MEMTGIAMLSSFFIIIIILIRLFSVAGMKNEIRVSLIKEKSIVPYALTIYGSI